MEEIVVKSRLRLLDHFSAVDHPRERAKVRFPLPELLFLVTCATIAGGDDYDIADWGEQHLEFLRQYLEYYFGTPKEDWLRTLINCIGGRGDRGRRGVTDDAMVEAAAYGLEVAA